jgi:hypothetical protein
MKTNIGREITEQVKSLISIDSLIANRRQELEHSSRNCNNEKELWRRRKGGYTADVS